MKKTISTILLGCLLVLPVGQARADLPDAVKISSGIVIGFAAGVYGLYYYMKHCQDEQPTPSKIKVKTQFVQSPEQEQATQLQKNLQKHITTAQLTLADSADKAAIIALFTKLGFRQANTYDPDTSKLLFEKEPASPAAAHNDSPYSPLF